MMWIYLLIISIAITGFFAIAMGLKLLFEKKAGFEGSSCGVDANTSEGNDACSVCEIKELANCNEKPVSDRELKTI